MQRRRKRRKPAEIIEILKNADELLNSGLSVAAMLRQLGISEANYHRWRNQYGGMKSDDMRRLKELEDENDDLKRVLTDQTLDLEILRDLIFDYEPADDAESRRRLVERLQQKYGVSERRACRIIDQPRSTQRYDARRNRIPPTGSDPASDGEMI